MEKEKEFKLGVFGTRTLTDNRVKVAILEVIGKFGATKIVTTAECGGVCKIARELSREIKKPLTVHYLNEKYAGGMFDRRSKDVINDSDYMLVIHNGPSKGTANEMELIKKMGVPYKYVLLKDMSKSDNFLDVEDFKVDDVTIEDI